MWERGSKENVGHKELNARWVQWYTCVRQSVLYNCKEAFYGSMSNLQNMKYWMTPKMDFVISVGTAQKNHQLYIPAKRCQKLLLVLIKSQKAPFRAVNKGHNPYELLQCTAEYCMYDGHLLLLMNWTIVDDN